jgi:BolA protein
MSTTARMERLLRLKLRPEHLELVDESAAHAGHPGAASGGGHYRVVIVSPAFEGRSRVERHRMVYEALGDLVGGEIHALVLKTHAPGEQR